MADHELLATCLRGLREDEVTRYRSFDTLYRESVRTVAAELRSTWGVAPQAIDEYLQEIYIRLWKARPSEGDIRYPVAWLRKVTKNCVIDLWRRNKKYSTTVDAGSVGGDDEPLSSILERLAARATDDGGPDRDELGIALDEERGGNVELRDCVQRVLAILAESNADGRLAIQLSTQDNLSDKEVAEVIGRSHGAVRTLLWQTRKKLQQLLQKHCSGHLPASEALS